MSEELALQLVDALAWPVTTVIIIVALRGAITTAIEALVALLLSWLA